MKQDFSELEKSALKVNCNTLAIHLRLMDAAIRLSILQSLWDLACNMPVKGLYVGAYKYKSITAAKRARTLCARSCNLSTAEKIYAFLRIKLSIAAASTCCNSKRKG